MTNPKNTTSNPGRRSFLLQAAAVAGSAAAVASSAGSPVMAYQSEPDPILAAIEAHRTVTGRLRSILGFHSELERTLPRDKRQSSVTAHGETIVATDDPRWIESERAVFATFDDETAAAIELINIVPTTAAGLFALLQYSISADRDGETWPCDLQSDDSAQSRTWHYFLIANLVEVLPGMVPA